MGYYLPQALHKLFPCVGKVEKQTEISQKRVNTHSVFTLGTDKMHAIGAVFTALAAIQAVYADVYMHNPRGSNDRNCETNDDRNNVSSYYQSMLVSWGCRVNEDLILPFQPFPFRVFRLTQCPLDRLF